MVLDVESITQKEKAGLFDEIIEVLQTNLACNGISMLNLVLPKPKFYLVFTNDALQDLEVVKAVPRVTYDEDVERWYLIKPILPYTGIIHSIYDTAKEAEIVQKNWKENKNKNV